MGTIAPRELEARLDQFRILDVREDILIFDKPVMGIKSLNMVYIRKNYIY
jgi:hypothetical protein